MESLANRSRAVPSRFQRTFRVEMGGRTVLVSLGLAVLTGLVIFYMGVLAGKGSRTAETLPPPTTQAPAGEQPAGTGNLAFSDSLLKDKPVVEDLWQSQQKTSQDTKDLLARAQRELTVEEVPATTAARPAADPPAQAAQPAQPAEARTAQAPAVRSEPAPAPRTGASASRQPAGNAAGTTNMAAAAPAGELFTVQVFSSKSRESALSLVNKLKGMGFAAYLNQFQDGGKKTWYRVRVGKTNRNEAERIKSSLEQRADLKSSQVLPL